MNRPENKHEQRRTGRSRVYERTANLSDVQGERTKPLANAGMQPGGTTVTVPSGQHDEGAATIGNSLRGAASQAGDVDDAAYPGEQDLTLGERFGGAMEAPEA